MKRKPRKYKVPQIITKKLAPDHLGRFIYGYCYRDENVIEINREQNNKEILNTYVHELLHYCFARLGEPTVCAAADLMSSILWNKGWRLPRRKSLTKKKKPNKITACKKSKTILNPLCTRWRLSLLPIASLFSLFRSSLA